MSSIRRFPHVWLVLGALLGLAALLELQSYAASAHAAVTRQVDLVVRTVNGDKAQVFSGAMAAIQLTVKDQTGAVIGQVKTDAKGNAVIAGVAAGSTVTVVAAAPSGYVSFPVTQAVDAMAPGRTLSVPLYDVNQQWTTWGRTNARLRVGPDAGTPKGKPIWQIDAHNNVEYPPSLAYGVVVYGSYYGFLCANDEKTGALLWRAYPGVPYKVYSKFANQVVVTSWVQNGTRVARVLYADLTGIVGCRDLFTGAVIWEKRSAKGSGTGGKTLAFKSVEASPLVQGETLYVCTRYNSGGGKAGVWALDRRTGAVRWFRRLGTGTASKIGSSPAYRNGRLFVATYDGVVCCLRAANGTILWRKQTGGQFYGTPAVNGSRLYIGNKSNGRMYCLSATSGRVLWMTGRLGASVHASPAVYGSRVFIGAGKHFYALNAATGRAIWRRSTSARIYGSATILKGAVYYSDVGRTYACSVRTGKLVWKASVGRYSPVTATRYLIVVCGRKTMYAYRPAN